jgi:RNA polymerase sigma-B factor
VSTRTFDETQADVRAAELVHAMAALPAAHPDRPALREAAIEAWLPMANRLARRYAGRGESLDDLVQAASLGLVKAIDRFDPAVGVEFVGYAIPTILGEVKRHFRDRGSSVRIPRRLQELRPLISQVRAELGHELNREPTVADIAHRLDVSEETVIEALESSHAYRPISLSMPVREGEELELGDTLGADDQGYFLTDCRVSLPSAMACLTERERHIIMLRFYGNLTQVRIAEKTGVSQMHVSRILTQALGKLRARLDGE